MNAILEHLEAGSELTLQEIGVAADLLLDPEVEDSRKEQLLEALSKKGETPAEIAGFVEAFLKHSIDPEIELAAVEGPTVDVCGTGGDRLNLFNVSTTSMFVVAAAGAVVAKHGNRGITSKSGGADVLEALGIELETSPAQFRKCIERAGVGFMFAPSYHPAFKAVAGVRKTLAVKGVRTIFNLIGPLLNPARPQSQLVGVYSEELCPVFAEILQRLGRNSAWVVHGTTADGRSIDELSLLGPTRICKSGRFQDALDEQVSPADFGFKAASVEELTGGDAATNADILVAILQGKERGPRLDMVLINAGAAIACCGLADHLGAGIELARKLVHDGSAAERLKALQNIR